MAKWVRSSVLDNGLNDIKNNAVKMLLISAYTAGDSYSTVVANTLASVDMVSTDYVLSSSSNNRLLTTASGKTGTATAAASGTPDLHIAFTDGVSSVIWVTDETSNRAVVIGDVLNFPSLVFTSNQPV